MRMPPIAALLQDMLSDILAVRGRMGKRLTPEERRRVAEMRAKLRQMAEQDEAP